MADRRVRQQPLDVGLHDGHERPDEQAEHGQGVDDGLPVEPVQREGQEEHPQEPGEAGHLHGRGHEPGDGRGGTLVDVGRPGVERHRRHLEAEADDQQHDAAEQQQVVAEGVGGEEVGDLDQVGRARGAVAEGDAVQEERRREATQHEVLDGGLARADPAGVHAGEDVDRDGQDLEAEEHHDEVVGRSHDHATRRRQEHEHEGLDPVEALTLDVAVEEQRAQDHRGADGEGGEQGEPVDTDRAGDGREGPGPGVVPEHPVPLGDGADAGGEADEGGERPVAAHGRAALQQRATDQQHDRPADEDQDGQDREVVDVGRGQLGGADGLAEDGDHLPPP